MSSVDCRGICEFSNVCTNDCGYCGIRKHQKGIRRYTMPIQEVVDVSVDACAHFGWPRRIIAFAPCSVGLRAALVLHRLRSACG